MIKLTSALACALLLASITSLPTQAAERPSDHLASPRWGDMEKGILSTSALYIRRCDSYN